MEGEIPLYSFHSRHLTEGMPRRQSRRNRRKTRKARRKQRGGAAAETVEGISFPNTASLMASFSKAEMKGESIPLEDTQEKPLIVWDKPSPGTHVTFICFDPDATAKSWLHWLVVNCTGVDTSSGTEIVDWTPPAPPSGTHTYYMATFEHVFPINVKPFTQRGYFNLQEFVKTHALEPRSITSFRTSAKRG